VSKSKAQDTITRTLSSKNPALIRTHNLELMSMLVHAAHSQIPQSFKLIHSEYGFDHLKSIFKDLDSGIQYGVTIRELKRKRKEKK